MTDRWIDTQDAFDALVDELAQVDRIALDTEFHRERTYFPKLALMQLAWEPKQLVLIDPLAVDVSGLSRVLKSDSQFVIHAASQDLEVLRLVCGSGPEHLFDTQIAASFVGYATPSLATLHQELLDEKLDKGERLTDWLVRPLSKSVLAYAAGDVRRLLEIADLLTADLERLERLAWAQDECERARVHGLRERDPHEAWKRVKEARRLHGRTAGIAREVATWREERAAQLDIPARFVLGDLGLVGIAQKPPSTEHELAKIRGVDIRAYDADVIENILEAVAQGIALGAPKSTRPRKPAADPRLRPAVALLSSWVSQFAKDANFDTQMLATRGDIEDFVADDPDGRLMHGWRAELIGRPMRSLLEGESALAFEPMRGIILEERSSARSTPDAG